MVPRSVRGRLLQHASIRLPRYGCHEQSVVSDDCEDRWVEDRLERRDPRASNVHQGPSRICLPNIRRYSLQLMAMDGAHCISFDGQRAWSANLTLIAIAGPWCTYAECFPLPHHRLRDARTEAIQRSLLVHPPRLVAARMGTILLPRRISPRRPVTLLQHLVKRY